MGAPFSDELIQEAVRVYTECNHNRAEAARRMNVASSTLFGWLQKAASLGMLGTAPILPGFRLSQVSTVKDAEGNTLREYVQQKPDAGETFSVPEGHAIKGVSAYLDSNGRVLGQWIKTREGELDPLAVAEIIKESLRDFEPPPLAPTPPPKAAAAELANIFGIPDLHMGQLSWGKETGGGDYDIKIAGATVKSTFNRLAANSPEAAVGVVLGLGDNSHTDGYKNVTPQSGHALDADGRYPVILRATIDTFAHAVAAILPRHDQVRVRVLPGNHDPQAAIAVSIALEERYRNEPRVTVDADPGVFWWWEWGACFVGGHHGDKTKMKDLPMTMAARNPEAWGRTRFRYIYTGHIHHESAVEVGGVVVESFRAVTALDAYNAGAGYASGRSMKSITLHRDAGEVGRQTVNIV
jgi:hypothetical protein